LEWRMATRGKIASARSLGAVERFSSAREITPPPTAGNL
jgi:hypothetical protein